VTRSRKKKLGLSIAVAVAAVAGVLATPFVAQSSEPTALWIGDSYTAGYHGGGVLHSGGCVASRILHWDCSVDAEGGTGFIANGQHPKNPAIANSVGRLTHGFTALPARLLKDKQEHPSANFVIIDAGRNDTDSAELRATVTTYLTNVRELWPHATLVVVLPYWLTTGQEALGQGFNDFYRQAAMDVDAAVLDPAAKPWTHPRDVSQYISSDGVHPSGSGYFYIGSNLAEELKAVGV
jgi:lysophospholipase L1-like esterase